MTYSNSRPDFAWLNEDSRLFLQRGYLLEGVSLALKGMQINFTTIWRVAIFHFLRRFGLTLV